MRARIVEGEGSPWIGDIVVTPFLIVIQGREYTRRSMTFVESSSSRSTRSNRSCSPMRVLLVRCSSKAQDPKCAHSP